jgi:hypothetical protein
MAAPRAPAQAASMALMTGDATTSGPECEVNSDVPGTLPARADALRPRAPHGVAACTTAVSPVSWWSQLLHLAIDQFFCVLRITSGEWSQSDGSTTLWDDHKIEPHHQEGLHRDVVDVGKGNGCRSSLTRDLGANELDTVPEDPQTLVAYGR